jgi:monoamine oxidase
VFLPGHAQESPYRGPLRLDGDPRGASVLVLGAGLAGMTAALELRQAGYRVRVLEYDAARAGGRCWTIRGGDRYEELGGAVQNCSFADGLYLNPGPWRIPYHHHAVLDYCRRLGVALEPFIQVNHNAYVHGRQAFGGKPRRFREIQADYHGHVAELLAKATRSGALDQAVSQEGALDRDMRYAKNIRSSDRRGFARDAGGGANSEPLPSEPLTASEVLQSRLWAYLVNGALYEFQTTMFQPVGGMDMIARAFAREVGSLITYNARVTSIRQDDRGVTVAFQDRGAQNAMRTERADWCVCTLPLSVLSQLELNVSPAKAKAIEAVPYSAAVKIGLQFRRRFWEQDEHIYGGISYTDLPIRLISYPSTGYQQEGPGVLLGAYTFGPYAHEFTSLPPEERVRRAVEWGAQIHPQYRETFESGIAVGWNRNPATLGCHGMWSDARRAEHYEKLVELEGRLVLAGEHASHIPAWMEGAILSALDAVQRLHRRVVSA